MTDQGHNDPVFNQNNHQKRHYPHIQDKNCDITNYDKNRGENLNLHNSSQWGVVCEDNSNSVINDQLNDGYAFFDRYNTNLGRNPPSAEIQPSFDNCNSQQYYLQPRILHGQIVNNTQYVSTSSESASLTRKNTKNENLPNSVEPKKTKNSKNSPTSNNPRIIPPSIPQPIPQPIPPSTILPSPDTTTKKQNNKNVQICDPTTLHVPEYIPPELTNFESLETRIVNLRDINPLTNTLIDILCPQRSQKGHANFCLHCNTVVFCPLRHSRHHSMYLNSSNGDTIDKNSWRCDLCQVQISITGQSQHLQSYGHLLLAERTRIHQLRSRASLLQHQLLNTLLIRLEALLQLQSSGEFYPGVDYEEESDAFAERLVKIYHHYKLHSEPTLPKQMNGGSGSGRLGAKSIENVNLVKNNVNPSTDVVVMSQHQQDDHDDEKDPISMSLSQVNERIIPFRMFDNETIQYINTLCPQRASTFRYFCSICYLPVAQSTLHFTQHVDYFNNDPETTKDRGVWRCDLCYVESRDGIKHIHDGQYCHSVLLARQKKHLSIGQCNNNGDCTGQSNNGIACNGSQIGQIGQIEPKLQLNLIQNGQIPPHNSNQFELDNNAHNRGQIDVGRIETINNNNNNNNSIIFNPTNNQKDVLLDVCNPTLTLSNPQPALESQNYQNSTIFDSFFQTIPNLDFHNSMSNLERKVFELRSIAITTGSGRLTSQTSKSKYNKISHLKLSVKSAQKSDRNRRNSVDTLVNSTGALINSADFEHDDDDDHDGDDPLGLNSRQIGPKTKKRGRKPKIEENRYSNRDQKGVFVSANAVNCGQNVNISGDTKGLNGGYAGLGRSISGQSNNANGLDNGHKFQQFGQSLNQNNNQHNINISPNLNQTQTLFQNPSYQSISPNNYSQLIHNLPLPSYLSPSSLSSTIQSFPQSNQNVLTTSAGRNSTNTIPKTSLPANSLTGSYQSIHNQIQSSNQQNNTNQLVRLSDPQFQHPIHHQNQHQNQQQQQYLSLQPRQFGHPSLLQSNLSSTIQSNSQNSPFSSVVLPTSSIPLSTPSQTPLISNQQQQQQQLQQQQLQQSYQNQLHTLSIPSLTPLTVNNRSTPSQITTNITLSSSTSISDQNHNSTSGPLMNAITPKLISQLNTTQIYTPQLQQQSIHQPVQINSSQTTLSSSTTTTGGTHSNGMIRPMTGLNQSTLFSSSSPKMEPVFNGTIPYSLLLSGRATQQLQQNQLLQQGQQQPLNPNAISLLNTGGSNGINGINGVGITNGGLQASHQLPQGILFGSINPGGQHNQQQYPLSSRQQQQQQQQQQQNSMIGHRQQLEILKYQGQSQSLLLQQQLLQIHPSSQQSVVSNGPSLLSQSLRPVSAVTTQQPSNKIVGNHGLYGSSDVYKPLH
jgi:hypothetical protein